MAGPVPPNVTQESLPANGRHNGRADVFAYAALDATGTPGINPGRLP